MCKKYYFLAISRWPLAVSQLIMKDENEKSPLLFILIINELPPITRSCTNKKPSH